MGLWEPSELASPDGLGVAVHDCVPLADAETATIKLIWLAVDGNEIDEDGDAVCDAVALIAPLSVRDNETTAVDEALVDCVLLFDRD